MADLMKAAEDDRADVRLAAVASLGRLGGGLDAAALQGIFDRWKDKIAYKDANATLQRLIARVQSAGTKPAK